MCDFLWLQPGESLCQQLKENGVAVQRVRGHGDEAMCAWHAVYSALFLLALHLLCWDQLVFGKDIVVPESNGHAFFDNLQML